MVTTWLSQQVPNQWYEKSTRNVNVVRTIVKWPLIRSGLILFLLLFASLIGMRSVMSQFCGSANGDLYVLPACAINVRTGEPVDNAYLTSVEPQTIIAQPGQNLSFTINYQIWLTTNTSSGCVGTPNMCVYQLLFKPSWKPWGTTPEGNTEFPVNWIVYDGHPDPGPPGTKGSASFQLTAPIEPGTYFLWLCIGMNSNGMYAGSFQEPRPPGHIKIIVSTHTSTTTVTAMIPGPMSFTSLNIPLVPIGLAGIAVVVMGSVAVAVKRGKLRIRRGKAEPSVIMSKPTISTGYPDLDGTLAGGIPEGYAVVLVSPSYDERDLLLRKIIDSAISSGRPAFYISTDIERTQDLLARYQRGFYAFSSQADKIAPNAANLYKIPGIENLSEATISLTLAMKQARAKEQATKMIVIIDILSDLLLRYKAVTTRRWLTDFVGKRKAEGFTTLATLNPLVGTKEDNQMVIDVFDGVIEIFEKELKERSRRFVIVKKMYGKKYSESELMLDKDKLF